MTDAPGLILSPTAQIGRDVVFGAHVVVHDGVVVGDGCTIGDGAVLGKGPRLAPWSNTPRSDPAALVIADGVIIGTQAVVFAGAQIGAGSVIGDQAFVRERTTVGRHTVVGRATGVDNDVRIGDRVRIQSQTYITAFSLVEDDVFFGPCAMTTNDDTMGRHPKGMPLRGATLRRACRIGGGAVLVPGVEIGEEAFVAAGSVVTADVPPRKVVMGVPARLVRDVPDADLLEQWA
jgi:UDP-2-acetamido-3-amino-2,3-dideoxy-glucuronate N-acetyltransferase